MKFKKFVSVLLTSILTVASVIALPSNTHIVKAETASAVGVQYTAHVQNVGWQSSVSDGQEAGTYGQSLRIEALKINLVNAPVDAHIKYQAHVQNIGWQDWASDGQEIGTNAKSLRVEALRIALDNMPGYSIQYRVHVQSIGWMDWVSDGQQAGTDGQALRIEALQIKLVKISDNTSVGVQYQGHVENIGWQSNVSNGQLAGTEGKALRVEALKIGLLNAPAGAHIKYQTHVQNIGWQAPVADNAECGTDGKALRVEAIKISLENLPGYSVQYRTHVQNIGWQSWVSDGQEAGTDGKSLRIEAIEIRLVKISSSQSEGFKNAAFNNSSQVITVTNSTKGSKYAIVNAYEKVNGQWNLVYSNMSSIIGQNGMEYDSNRRQDTNTTPAGIYNIPLAFGWGGNPGTKIPFRIPDNNSYWNLNSGSSTYNRWVQGNPGGDYEYLKTERLYKYALVLDYNWNQTPGKGGAIFIHLNPNYYTGGCVGLDESNLVQVMKWLDPSKNPKVLICPQGDLSKYYY